MKPNCTRRPGARPLLVAAFAALVLSACSGSPEPEKKPGDTPPVQPAKDGAETQAAAGVIRLSTADVVAVREGGVQPVIAVTGSLEPLLSSIVNARVPAVVDAVLVREGETVRAGQTLVRQNTDDLTAQLRQAEAALAAARVELQLTEGLEKRKKELYAKQYISEIDFAAAQGETEVRHTQVNVQEANVAIARKAVADAQVHAPIGGLVAQRHVEPGTKPMPGQPLVTLVDLSELELQAAVPARDVPRIATGAQVRFTVDGFGEREFEGRIVRINPVADAARNVRIYARVANADLVLRGGMFAKGQIRLPVDDTEGALHLPLAAVRSGDGQSWVWVVRKDRLKRVDVNVEARDEGNSTVQVTGGLEAGEPVVMTELANPADGTPVALDAR